MKKLIVLVCLMTLLFVSCKSTDTDITVVAKDGTPIWVSQIPQSKKLYYGVGSAKLSNLQNSQSSADVAARSDLAKKLQATIEEATVNYTNDSEKAVAQAYESIVLQTVKLTMKGVKIEQRYTATDGRVYSLVSFEAKKLKDLYKDAANDYKNQLEEKKLKLEQEKLNLEAKKAELIAAIAVREQELTEKNAAQKTLLASHEADSGMVITEEAVNSLFNSSVDAVNTGIKDYDKLFSAIDVDKLVTSINDKVSSQGYTE